MIVSASSFLLASRIVHILYFTRISAKPSENLFTRIRVFHFASVIKVKEHHILNNEKTFLKDAAMYFYKIKMGDLI